MSVFICFRRKELKIRKRRIKISYESLTKKLGKQNTKHTRTKPQIQSIKQPSVLFSSRLKKCYLPNPRIFRKEKLEQLDF